MSSDYAQFAAEQVDQLANIAKMLTGEAYPQDLDPLQFIMQQLPVMLAMPLPGELRSLVLAQYVDIQAALRDMELGEMSREDFFRLGALTATRDINRLQSKSSQFAVEYAAIKVRMSKEDKEILDQLDSEHTDFRQHLNSIVKSSLNIADEEQLSAKDVLAYIAKERKNG